MYSIKLTINWNNVSKEYNITKGVKIIKHYKKGCFFQFCCENNYSHHITIEYDENYIHHIYQEYGIVNIITRNKYEFFNVDNKKYITFKLDSDYLEIKIN
jgi:hypothetical protein